MGLSIYNIKKWTKMLLGKSIMHVNQDLGKSFIPGELKGYFNNLTEKVTKDPVTLRNRSVPLSTDEKEGTVYFPVTVFQYGLGTYDLYLQTHEEQYIEQFWNCVNSAVEHQERPGVWNNFGFLYPNAPYGSMCQGEAASFFLRAYRESGDVKYLEIAKKAIEFMLTPIEKGGTAKYEDNDIILYEFTNKPVVLNGWIFSLYGLYDLCLVEDNEKYHKALNQAVHTLRRYLPEYDNGYWSMYDLGGRIASPFYHNLHIAQMEALAKTFNDPIFKKYEDQFRKYREKGLNQCRAFVKKALQKIMD